MTLVLQSDQSPKGTPFTDEEISWMASARFITSIPAVVFFGYIVDKFGRKFALLVCTAQFVGRWAIKLSSSEFAGLFAARALVGAGMSGCYVVGPLYTNEISESCIRGTLGTLTSKIYNDISVMYVQAVAWNVKNFIVVTMLSVACEKFYSHLDDNKNKCAEVLDVSPERSAFRKTIKNILRLCNVKSKMRVCGLFTVDAALPLRLLGLVATYYIVLLQFAFL
ncbi:Vacuolar protein sorting-associated protein 73 [Eumeta japonica]|uniref:Vacuolar protein sorting-associated protein 73 n=1 Tax=Eumeta variegata TaxID=151549 RepID=A0A4C1YJU1_EUMVA|nr:Vacuolar protein sorting-associated protein 73 [Eumeta japonica]